MTTHCLDRNRGNQDGTSGNRPPAKRWPTARTWTREQIRAARLAPLAPLLQKRGLRLNERPAQNLEVLEYKGLVIKDSYWRWPARNQAGNAIDFFVKVLGLSFHDAMTEIIGS